MTARDGLAGLGGLGVAELTEEDPGVSTGGDLAQPVGVDAVVARSVGCADLGGSFACYAFGERLCTPPRRAPSP